MRWRNHLWRGRWSEVWKAAPFSPNKTWFSAVEFGGDTVDGSEIRQALVEVGSLSHYLQVFVIYIPGGCLGVLNHQQ